MPKRYAGLLFLALLAAPTFSHASCSHPITIVYDRTNGSLTIQTNGCTITGYMIAADADVFLESVDPLESTTHQPFLNGTSRSTPRELVESNIFAPQSGDFNIGNVLPPGLSESDFSQIPFTQWNYTSEFGEPISEFMVIAGIPEPSSFAVLTASGLLLARRRRA